MPFNLILKFKGLCAIAKKADNKKLHVLLPDARTGGLSYGDQRNPANPSVPINQKRFFTHTPYISFSMDTLDSSQKSNIIYVSKDKSTTPIVKQGFLVLQKDLLKLTFSSTLTNLNPNLNDPRIDSSSYLTLPDMSHIYHDTATRGVNLDTSYITDESKLDSLVGRITLTQGNLFGDTHTKDLFKFQGRPGSPAGNIYDDANGFKFSTKLKVVIPITSSQVTLSVGGKDYKFSPPSSTPTSDVEIGIFNMPADRIGESPFDLTLQDDFQEDFDFELLYSVADSGTKPTDKPRVPKKKTIGVGGAGTFPPMVCGLAVFNDF